MLCTRRFPSCCVCTWVFVGRESWVVGGAAGCRVADYTAVVRRFGWFPEPFLIAPHVPKRWVGPTPAGWDGMTWLRFRLSATLLASTYHHQSSILGVRAFAGFGGKVVRFNRAGASSLSLSMSTSSPPPSTGPQGGGGKANRLADETSPYLLQHAQNPVDWMPWGQEAFRRAKEEDKPIFLSVGYSTCHWCGGAIVVVGKTAQQSAVVECGIPHLGVVLC